MLIMNLFINIYNYIYTIGEGVLIIAGALKNNQNLISGKRTSLRHLREGVGYYKDNFSPNFDNDSTDVFITL